MILRNNSGLTVQFLENGSVKSIEAGPIRIGLQPATLYSSPGTNIFLRKRDHQISYYPLTGPYSKSHYFIRNNIFYATGFWEGLEYSCSLSLSSTDYSWKWQISVTNTNQNQIELDLIYLQDVGLKQKSDNLINEYYTSQYIERLIFDHKDYGSVVCCRQNMKEPTGHPWLMLACKNGAISGCTDGMQFYGKNYREKEIPEELIKDTLGGNCAGESPVVALQEKPFTLKYLGRQTAAFIGFYMPDHPMATTSEDLKRLDNIFNQFLNLNNIEENKLVLSSKQNLFNTSPFLPAEDLNNKEIDLLFGPEKNFVEEENGKILSFFNNQNHHIVLKQKELMVDRPHGHIMQANINLIPDENIMSTTAFAGGIFNSHITQGNTNFNTLLSINNNAFYQYKETGQRIFVKTSQGIFLLGIPSAYEMGINHCRWIYKFSNFIFQVRTWTMEKNPQINTDFEVIQGKNVDLLITHHFDYSNHWVVYQGNEKNEFIAQPASNSSISRKFPSPRYRIIFQHPVSEFITGNDELLFNDDHTATNQIFVFKISNAKHICISILGEVCRQTEPVLFNDFGSQFSNDREDFRKFWNDFSMHFMLNGKNDDILAIKEIFPWFGLNALVHYLTPYGLEQFSGAAWGTRDVTQGPVELLLSMQKYQQARKVLCIIFSHQNSDGSWPQWWMFDSYKNIRAHEAHGDIIYWCIIALSNYINITGDLTIMDEQLPFYSDNNKQTKTQPVKEHVNRIITLITNSFIKKTSFVPYGGGDWNDSLQPVSKEFSKRLISSWTVEMNYQAFSLYSQILEKTGHKKQADSLKKICLQIQTDFNKYLIKDNVVAGYGYVNDVGTISLLLHPSDPKTGIKYSILPMNRGIISGIFSKEQALHHQQIIEQHLKGPDGARLMDKPLQYKGGIQTIFQRAESSTYFGREIGLMYIHEHIRYAESLAIMGKADEFVFALRQANPIAYDKIVKCGDLRQSNCYYSSSDAVFESRYHADQKYQQIIDGTIKLKGGWRVYSSGPGIYLSIIITRLLGLRIDSGNIIFDPVVPVSFNGFEAMLNWFSYHLKIKYHIKNKCFGPDSIQVNGQHLTFDFEQNKYRKGGLVLQHDYFLSKLENKENLIEIFL